MPKISEQPSARQRVGVYETKFFAYIKKNASPHLRDLLRSIDRRACVEMSKYVIFYSRRPAEKSLFFERRQRAKKISNALTATIHNLEKLNAAYRGLTSIEIPEVGALGGPGSLLWPQGTLFFGDVLEAELKKLLDLLAIQKEIYNEKRFGMSGNHTWLVILEEFTAAWTERELGAVRRLRADEIGDLITAAKAALGWREEQTETDPELIRKAIHKYRANSTNLRFLSRSIIPYVLERCDVVAHGPYLLGIEI